VLGENAVRVLNLPVSAPAALIRPADRHTCEYLKGGLTWPVSCRWLPRSCGAPGNFVRATTRLGYRASATSTLALPPSLSCGRHKNEGAESRVHYCPDHAFGAVVDANDNSANIAGTPNRRDEASAFAKELSTRRRDGLDLAW
jgi:hypothetical protein